MREMGCLLRIQMYRFCGINGLLHGKDARQKRRALTSLGLGLLITAMAVGYSLMFALMLADVGAASLLVRGYAIVISLVCVAVVLMKGPNQLFAGIDTPMLRAMPVRTISIVLSRMAGVLLPLTAVSMLMMGTACAVYARTQGAGCAVIAFVLSGFLPMLPMAFALAIGTGVSLLTSRMRHRAAAAAALNILLLVGVLSGAGVITLASVSGQIASWALRLMTNLQEILTGLYPPADWLWGAAHGSLTDGLLLAGCSLGALALTAWVSTRCFFRIADGLSTERSVKRGAAVLSRPTSALHALYRKELRRFTSSAIYMMNSMAGILMYGILTLGVCLALTRLGELLPVPVQTLTPLAAPYLPFAAAMTIGMSTTTACAVSMEGRHMDILRAAPVRMRDWMGAKLLLSLSLAAGPDLIFGGILSWQLGFGVVDTLGLLAAPLIHAAFIGVLGLLLNLRFPRFDWNQDVQAVKQGISVLVTLMTGMLLPMGLLYLAVKLEAACIVLMSAAVCELLLSVGGFAWLCRLRMPQ